ncbi:MAG: AI-2E family transporter [[Clostridium] spiroforme]|uniref:AI-2E family transporter n=1 Tax=Thomasclavelia spiroformis TaxID=29348 RepID=A0A943I5L3_9FIRM|nr:AI-2E family transporter [Thomasclavelia spiroformis]MBS5587605.1 AI-2E family transporter [Thomasclavelia spiroformis]
MKERLVKYLYWLIVLFVLIIATYVLVNWLIPLFFSCLIVLILQPLLAREIKLLKIKRSLLAKAIIIFNYGVFIVLAIGLLVFCIIQIYNILEILPDYLQELYIMFSNNSYIIDISKYLDFIYSGSMSLIENVSGSFIHGLIMIIMKIPSIMFDLIFVIMTSLFMLLDYPRIDNLLIKRYHMVSLVVDTTKEVFSNLFKAYFIIMIVTFFELWVGFLIIQLEYSMVLACIIAIFDFLPLLGIDMIMIPWIVICAFTNKISLALGLLVIYLVIVITKNILEPKLIAKGLGISPLVSLIGMYLGMKVLGFVGLIIVPIILVIVIQVIKVKMNYDILNKQEGQ